MAVMNQKPLKVAISVPNESYIPVEAYDNHMMLMKHLGGLEKIWEFEKRQPRYEFYWYTTGRLLTPMAREVMINKSLSGGMDYIIMLDNDMIYPIDTIECLLQDVELHPEIDILAPLAFMRNPPHNAVIYTVEDGYDHVTHQSYYINNFYKNYPKDKIVECDAVGFGAVLINMNIIKKMQAPYCFSTTGSGEDIYFCHKAKREANARVFMDTRIKLGHLGKSPVVDEEYVESYNKKHKVEVEEIPHKYLSYEK